MDLPVHVLAQVSGIGDQSTEMLELLKHRNIKLGTWLEVKRKFSFDESVELRIKNASAITISAQMAKNIFVRYDKPDA
jgi:DtxR family Mn-dependent transcriptional regulator